MKVINIHRLQLQFTANSLTKGSPSKQANSAINQINRVIDGALPGLGAELISHRDEVEIETDEVEGQGPCRVDLSKSNKVLALQVAQRMYQNGELLDLSPNPQPQSKWHVDLSDDTGNTVETFAFKSEKTGIAFINLVIEINNLLNTQNYVK